MKKENCFPCNKSMLLFVIGIVLFNSICFVSALETTQISYIQSVTYTPYCNTICTNNVTTNSTTNYTTDKTDCTSGCYGVFNMTLIFAGDLSPRTYEINTSSPLYKNGSSFMVPGVYLATLGNTSDVTGINEKIKDLTSTITNDLINCYINNSAIQNNATTTLNICNLEKQSISVSLGDKSNKLLEAEKYKSQRVLYAIGFLILGFLAFKYGEPWLRGRTTKKDPNQTSHSPMEGQY